MSNEAESRKRAGIERATGLGTPAVRDRLVTNLDELPADFRQRVIDTGQRLADQRQPRAGE